MIVIQALNINLNKIRYHNKYVIPTTTSFIGKQDVKIQNQIPNAPVMQTTIVNPVAIDVTSLEVGDF